MKTIVYFDDGSIEATVWADTHVANGIARYATPEECASYERHFELCDAPHFARDLHSEDDKRRDVDGRLPPF